MSAPNRVDDLRKRYSENPRRFFAPLANEYRKTGFIDRAILLCEKHLGEQPGNMNGLVVYGQCLFETGRLDAARGPFEAALGVDPENLIALRHLGDIARLGGDDATARQWYERVLEFDRRNDEVQALLAEVGGGEAQAPTPSIAPNIVSVASSVRVTSGTEALGMIDLDAPARPATPAAPTPAVRTISRTPAPVDPTAKTLEVSAQPRPPKRGSMLDINFDFGEFVDETPAPAPAPPQALLPSEAAEYGFAEIEAGPSAEDVLDSIMIEEPSAPASAPAPALASAAMDAPLPAPTDSPMAELGEMQLGSLIEQPMVQESLAEIPAVEGLELAEFEADVAPLAELESHEFEGGEAAPLDGLESAEFQAPAPEVRASIPSIAMDNLSLDAIGDGLVADLPLLSPMGEPETEPRRSSPTDGIPLLPPLEEAETLRIDVDELRRRFETPATFVTETMAELYVQQGLREKAVEVYRQLIQQAPYDQGLKDRLSALQAPPVTATPVASAAPVAEAPAAEAAALELEEFPEFPEFPEFEAEAPPAPPTPAPSKPEPRATAPRITLDFETPTTADLAIEPPAPANAMLSAMSFADVSLTTPADPARREPTPVEQQLPVVEPMPVVEPLPVATGPSAREFFAAFARRLLTPISTAAVVATAAVPSAAGGPLSPLDEIFGLSVDSEDERSAHRLAAIGATSGPSGGSALDSIFGEGPSAPMPPEGPSALGPRSSVGRASTKLRFDQFFASSIPSATPSGTPSVQEPEAVAEPFVEPVAEPIAEPASANEPAEGAQGEEPPEDDDLDQFQGWLRGLTQ